MNFNNQGRTHVQIYWTIFVAGLALLQGCSDSIDAREMREIRGLIYKYNKDDPFTGKITNYQMTTAGVLVFGICDLEVKKGEFHGTMLCKANNGKKVLEAEYSAGKKQGREEIWDAATGETLRRTHWEAGRKQGLEEFFNPAQKVLVRKIEWKSGEKQGKEIAWDLTGKTVLTDLTWEGGRKTGFIKQDMTETNFLNSLFHGTRREFKLDEAKANAVLPIANASNQVGAGYFLPDLGAATLSKEVEYSQGEPARVIYDPEKTRLELMETFRPCINRWIEADAPTLSSIPGQFMDRWLKSCQEGKVPAVERQ